MKKLHTPFVFFVFQLAIPLWYSFCIRAIKHCIPWFVLHTLFYGIYAIVCCLILVEQYIRATIPCHSQHIPRYILSMYIRVVQGLCRIIELYHFILPDFSVGTVARSWRRISHSIWFWCVNIFDSAIVMSWGAMSFILFLYYTRFFYLKGMRISVRYVGFCFWSVSSQFMGKLSLHSRLHCLILLIAEEKSSL